MVFSVIRKKYRNLKRKKEIKTRFSTSTVSQQCSFNNDTILEGFNVINKDVNICSSFIGMGTVIGPSTILKNCKVGRFCSIASGIHVQVATHPLFFVSTYPGFFNTINNYPFGKGEKDFDEILKCADGYYANIGNDVWIGENVTIKGGVTIGDGAVIGMGAVVTKDVPPYAVVGGVPSKIIKYRFSDEIIGCLLQIKWWEWDIKKIQDNRKFFTDINRFIKFFHKE